MQTPHAMAPWLLFSTSVPAGQLGTCVPWQADRSPNPPIGLYVNASVNLLTYCAAQNMQTIKFIITAPGQMTTCAAKKPH